MTILAHNEKITFLNKQVIMLYEIYSIKNYHYTIINSIIILRLILFKLVMVALRSRGESESPTTSRGTSEECHKGRTSWGLVKARPFSCEHWTWCGYPLICQPFNSHLTYFYLCTGKSFRSVKFEACMVCHNSIRNITSSYFISYATGSSLINCV